MESLADLLQWHYVNFPGMEICDAVKLLYQHFLGPEHLITEERAVLSLLEDEMAQLPAQPDMPASCALGNGLCRLNLAACKALGLSAGTAARLFLLTARQFSGDRAGFEQSLELIRALPFPAEQVDAYLTDYRARGCPAVRHSPRYRALHRPAYRVVAESYVRMLPALCAIDREAQRIPELRVAIDGPCASGKSTLGAELAAIYDCPLLHMDDFFLRPEQRTPARLAQPGGNVDYERFAAEVLAPLRAGRPARFRPWRCAEGNFGAEIAVSPAPLIVTEGCYSLHPTLRDSYQIGIWVCADPAERRRRLLLREGADGLTRFEALWIPMEERYFSAYNVKERCRVRLDLS